MCNNTGIMEAILKFDLNDPDDRHEFARASRATALCSTLWDLDQYLRGRTKYYQDDKDKSKDYNEGMYAAFDEARDKLYEIMNGEGIDLENIYN